MGLLPPCWGEPVSVSGTGRGERRRGMAVRGLAVASPLSAGPPERRRHPGPVWPLAGNTPAPSLSPGSRMAFGEGCDGGGGGLAGAARSWRGSGYLCCLEKAARGCGQAAAGETKELLPLVSLEQGADSVVPGSRPPAPCAGRVCLLPRRKT